MFMRFICSRTTEELGSEYKRVLAIKYLFSRNINNNFVFIVLMASSVESIVRVNFNENFNFTSNPNLLRSVKVPPPVKFNLTY